MRDQSGQGRIGRDAELAAKRQAILGGGIEAFRGRAVVDASDAIIRDVEAPVERGDVLAATDDQIVGPAGQALGHACDARLEMPRPCDAGDVARASKQTRKSGREIRHEDMRVRDVDSLPAENPGDPADDEWKRENVQRQAGAIEIAAEVQRHFVMTNPRCGQPAGEIAFRRVDDRDDLETSARHLGGDVREPRRTAGRSDDLGNAERP